MSNKHEEELTNEPENSLIDTQFIEGDHLMMAIHQLFGSNLKSSRRQDLYGLKKLARTPAPQFSSEVSVEDEINARSQLFRLPSEILAMIFKYIPSNELYGLAITCWHGRQLARSQQLCEFLVDFSPSSTRLLIRILSDAVRSQMPLKTANQRWLNMCIRYLRVETSGDWLARVAEHDPKFPTHDDMAESNRMYEIFKKGEERAITHYLSYSECITIAIKHVPKLHRLDFRDDITLTPGFLSALMKSSVRHLTLGRCMVSPRSTFPQEHSQWPLESLNLFVVSENPVDGNAEEYIAFGAELLRRCAPTLQSFKWDMPIDCSAESGDGDKIHTSFPELRELELYECFSNLSIFEDLLSRAPKLRHLRVYESSEGSDRFVKFARSWSSLRGLDYFCMLNSLECSIKILKSLPKLQKISLQVRPEDEAMFSSIRDAFLPYLAHSSHKLLSLSLRVPGNTIPDDILHNIDKLRTLEQLHLVSGHQNGSSSTWAIDHDAILENLSGLSNLRKLAFTGDAYPIAGYEDVPVKAYYYARITNGHSRDRNGTPEEDDELAGSAQNDSDLYAGAQALLGHGRLGEEFAKNYDGHPNPVERHYNGELVTNEEQELYNIWEVEHTGRMLKLARRYFRTFPRLRWLYCRQLVMVTTDAKWPLAMQVSRGRDDCHTYIQKTFGCQVLDELHF